MDGYKNFIVHSCSRDYIIPKELFEQIIQFEYEKIYEPKIITSKQCRKVARKIRKVLKKYDLIHNQT